MKKERKIFWHQCGKDYYRQNWMWSGYCSRPMKKLCPKPRWSIFPVYQKYCDFGLESPMLWCLSPGETRTAKNHTNTTVVVTRLKPRREILKMKEAEFTWRVTDSRKGARPLPPSGLSNLRVIAVIITGTLQMRMGCSEVTDKHYRLILNLLTLRPKMDNGI